MATILGTLPKGEKVGIAFSGRPRHERGRALDARERRDPLRLHREPRPARRVRLRRDPAQGARLRRREGAARRVPPAARRRGHRRDPVRRVPHLDRRRAPTSTPRRSAARSPARCWWSRCARTASASGATAAPTRATTSSASTATACSPTRAAHLQAVARPALHRRAGRPQGDVRVPGEGRPRLQDERREGVLDRLQHPRRRRTRRRTSSSSTRACRIVQPIMGVAFWRDDVKVKAETVSVALRRGPAGRAQRPALRRRREADARGQRHRRPARPGHVATRSRTASSRPRAAASTRRRAWRCCTSPTSGW